MHVAVTGAAGRLGQVLLPALARAPTIEHILALDRAAPALPPPENGTVIEARVLDLAQLQPEDLAGVDTLVHLAFQLMGGHGGRRRHDRTWVRQQNVALSQQVFHAAVTAGVRHIVFLSSAAVYGPWPDSPQPLREDHPTRPRFPYAEDKVAVEQALLALAREYPECQVTLLRPPAIVGPNAHPLLLQIARGRLYPAGGEQPVQILWEDDAAAAMVRSITTRTAGIFNLGAEPAWSLRAMARHQRRWGIPVPLRLIRTLHPLAWRLTARAGDPGWVRGLDGPLVLDCTRAREQLGWTPQVTTAGCLERLRC
ncbi:NAD-dependent epimerase/dehydratase family protein [Thioalkalivibrio versutus]|uniref:NAD-dependent epimerase/dehydratase family protein n=1 Tax=Thioalkalivibrio versutus TaxID=106634 RepID=UPI00036B0B67|nr:NAD-dependent epimerase/dehydratase family protein [Thioalkalivibrio versutus]OOC49500.1 NAD-dependent dehydratase [Thioalkalivibrio versutus]